MVDQILGAGRAKSVLSSDPNSRTDRAGIIRDEVLKLDASHGVFERWHAGIARLIEGPGWTARMHGPFNRPAGKSAYTSLLFNGRRNVRRETRMSLWLDDGPKVLTIVWDEHNISVVTMRRGSWEAQLFGLNEYAGLARRIDCLGRPKARRW